MSTSYRPGLPPIPWRLRHRPVERGYPVPWFCEEVSPGQYDFRIADFRKLAPAVRGKLCWLCGQPLGGYKAFCVGPMCAINRTTSEPPSHRDCAEFACLACPFLTQKEHGYRSAGLPEGVSSPAGMGIMRQPGVALLWVTKSYRPFRVGDGVLFTIGAPVETRWYREGRAATRAEVLDSIDSGYPILLTEAEKDGPEAVRELEAARDRALVLLPPEQEPSI